MKWQRQARLVIAAVGIGSAVAIVVLFRDRPPEAAPATLRPTDVKAVAEGGAANTVWFGKSERRARFSYKSWARYENPNRMLNFGAEIFFEAEGLTINADEAEIRGETTNAGGPEEVVLNGNVRVQTKDGLVLITPNATYNNTTGIVQMPGKVNFTKGRMAGEGLGGTYIRPQELFQLHDQAHVTLAPVPDAAGAPSGGMDARSKAMTVARQEHFTRLEGDATITRPTETLTSDSSTIYFTDDESEIKQADLQGHAAVTPTAGAANAPPKMEADNISLNFEPETRILNHATLNGSGKLTMADPAGERSITGQWIDLTTARDGSTLTRLESRDRVKVVLPKRAGAPGRTIDAATLVATGEEGKGLTRARFDAAQGAMVTFVEEAEKGKPRKATSKTLVLGLDGSLEAISQADFTTQVRFESEDSVATSEFGTYRAAKPGAGATLQLRMPSGSTVKPDVTRPDMRVNAREIDLGLDTEDLNARGEVRSKMLQSKDGTRKASALFEAGRDTFGASETLSYSSAAGRAVYTSTAGTTPARLWQDGGSTVSGREIAVDEKTGNLQAKGAVQSDVLVTEDGGGGKTTESRYVMTSETLDYNDEARRAIYRGDLATLSSEGRRTEAIEIVMILSDEGRTLKGFKATDKVFTIFDQYEAKGDQLDYQTASDVYLLTGRPVTAVGPSEDGKGCVKVIGVLAQIDRKTRQVAWPDPPNRGVQTDPSWPCGKSIR